MTTPEDDPTCVHGRPLHQDCWACENGHCPDHPHAQVVIVSEAQPLYSCGLAGGGMPAAISYDVTAHCGDCGKRLG